LNYSSLAFRRVW